MPEFIPSLYSQNVKAKGQVYFFDVKEAKNGHRYLNITQSRLSKDGQKQRSTITVFADHLDDFNQAFAQVQEKVK